MVLQSATFSMLIGFCIVCLSYKDTEGFSVHPSSENSYPRCEVRETDMDLYIDHFSHYWVIIHFHVQRYLFGKKLLCAPYVKQNTPRRESTCVRLCLFDNLPGMEEVTSMKPVHFLRHKTCNFVKRKQKQRLIQIIKYQRYIC